MESILTFEKYQGTGNDFVVMDNRDGKWDALTANQLRALCDRHKGIGADGVLLLEPPREPGHAFSMRYHNADGNTGSFCGNGARCLVDFAQRHMSLPPHVHFLAADGPHEAWWSGTAVRVRMHLVQPLSVLNEKTAVLNTGSPHWVQRLDTEAELDAWDALVEGRNVRYSEPWAREGINVNAYCPTPTGLRMKTYERGVEAETLSCGTGSVAVAVAHAAHLGLQPPWKQQLQPLGGPVEVEQLPDGSLWLQGPATLVFSGSLRLNSENS